MKYDNYFYLNNENNFYLTNTNNIEHFDTLLFEGPKGENGNLGYTGSRGLQGLQGVRGQMGFQGNEGDQGPKGYRGIAGQQGEKGLPGIDGEKGNIGLQGYIGPRGDFGPRGTPGPKGDEGIKGLDGFTGYMGPVGDPGVNGESGAVQPKFIENDLEQGLNLIGSQLTMDGISDVNKTLRGKMQNPYVPFTIDYNYRINTAKSVVCPPNTYLKGFSFMKKGELNQGDWGSSSGNQLNVGWKAKGKKQGNDFNKTRHGLPHSFKVNCHRLNSSNTNIEQIS